MYESKVTAYLLEDSFTRKFCYTDHWKRTAFAEEKWKEDRYRSVANWVVDFFVGWDAAEQVYKVSNEPARHYDRESLWGNHRSMCVGDIVEVTNEEGAKFYLCDSLGWVELKGLTNE